MVEDLHRGPRGLSIPTVDVIVEQFHAPVNQNNTHITNEKANRNHDLRENNEFKQTGSSKSITSLHRCDPKAENTTKSAHACLK
jgi:hypothetical protein